MFKKYFFVLFCFFTCTGIFSGCMPYIGSEKTDIEANEQARRSQLPPHAQQFESLCRSPYYAQNKTLLALLHASQTTDCLQAAETLFTFKQLDISSQNISDLEPLKFLSHLEILNLANNQIATVSALESLVSLEVLDLRKNPIKPDSLSSLARLPKLKKIILD